MNTSPDRLVWRVGLTIILAAIALGVILFLTGNYHLMEDGYHLNVMFNYAKGIEVGAPVLVSGVKLGTVEDVDFVYQKNASRVRLKLWILNKAVIKQDAKVYIESLGLLGQSAIEITTGSEQAAAVAPNSTLEGEAPFVTEEVLAQAREVAEGLAKSVDLFNSILEDAHAKENIRITLQNAATASAEFERTIKDNGARIDAIARAVEKTAGRLDDVSENASKDLLASIQNFRAASDDLRAILQKNRPKADDVLENIRRASDTLDKAVKDIRAITEKTAAGKSAIGILASDSQAAKQAKNIMNNLEQLSEDIRDHPWKLIRKP